MVWIFSFCKKAKKNNSEGSWGNNTATIKSQNVPSGLICFRISLTLNAWKEGIIYYHPQYSPCSWLKPWHIVGAQLLQATYAVPTTIGTFENLIGFCALGG